MVENHTVAETTGSMRCNGRKSGYADQVPKEPPGEHAGDGYCGQTAGWGTDHPGTGRCKFHNGRPPTHGRYSRYLKTSLGDEIDRLREDPDPLDLTEEVHLARALLRRALDNDDFSDASRMSLVSEISKIVKRIEDVRAQNAISVKDLQRLMMEMGRVVAQHVEDQEIIDRIRDEWRSIRL